MSYDILNLLENIISNIKLTERKFTMKKLSSVIIAAVMAISLCACSGNSDGSSSEPVKAKNKDSNFDKYISNTVVATGNNSMVDEVEKATYRAYFPVEEYGNLEYCFYFSNTVDSTYDKGSTAYAGN